MGVGPMFPEWDAQCHHVHGWGMGKGVGVSGEEPRHCSQGDRVRVLPLKLFLCLWTGDLALLNVSSLVKWGYPYPVLNVSSSVAWGYLQSQPPRAVPIV